MTQTAVLVHRLSVSGVADEGVGANIADLRARTEDVGHDRSRWPVYVDLRIHELLFKRRVLRNVAFRLALVPVDLAQVPSKLFAMG